MHKSYNIYKHKKNQFMKNPKELNKSINEKLLPFDAKNLTKCMNSPKKKMLMYLFTNKPMNKHPFTFGL